MLFEGTAGISGMLVILFRVLLLSLQNREHSFRYSWIHSYGLVNASLSDVRKYSHQLYKPNWLWFVIFDQKSEVCDYADSDDSLVNCTRRLQEARNNIISHSYADGDPVTHSSQIQIKRILASSQ